MAQTELVWKTAKWRRSDVKGSETRPESTKSPKTEVFLNFRILFDILMQNYQQEMHLCKVV